jgi:putative resolvase
LQSFLETGQYRQLSVAETGNAAIYSRVSASKQKADLQTQTDALHQRAVEDGFNPCLYSDIGSGLNDQRPRFLKLLVDGVAGKYDRIYITYRDRLARFGTGSYEEILRALNIPIICLNEAEDNSLENRLVSDVLAVITSFAGKLHRSRRGKIAV